MGELVQGRGDDDLQVGVRAGADAGWAPYLPFAFGRRLCIGIVGFAAGFVFGFACSCCAFSIRTQSWLDILVIPAARLRCLLGIVGTVGIGVMVGIGGMDAGIVHRIVAQIVTRIVVWFPVACCGLCVTPGVFASEVGCAGVVGDGV